jgi:hypothetical protein
MIKPDAVYTKSLKWEAKKPPIPLLLICFTEQSVFEYIWLIYPLG